MVTGNTEPNTIKQAYSSTDKEHQKKAIFENLNQILAQNTIQLVLKTTVLKQNKKLITARQVFKRKINKDRNLDKFKARLIVRGFQ